MFTLPARRQLDEGTSAKLRFQSPHALTLSESSGDVLKGIHLAKVGNYHHANYGEFAITDKILSEMIENFSAGAYGQKIFVDVAHKPENGAGAEILKIYRDGEWLKGDLQLTEFGRKAITEKRYIYLSIDYADNWMDSESGKETGAMLFGAGLTIRPFIKNQPGIMLAEPATSSKHGNNTMNYLEQLTAHLKKIQATDVLTKLLTDHFTVTEKTLDEGDTKGREALLASSIATANQAQAEVKKLSEGQAVSITLAAPTATQAEAAKTEGLTTDQVNKMLDDRDKSRTLAEQASAKKLSDNQAAFDQALEDAEGLSADTVKTLSEARTAITEHYTPEQVKQLADIQIKLGHQMEVQKQLSSQGFQVAGSPQISVDDSNSVKKLSVEIRKHLGTSNAAGNGQIKLAEKESPFVSKVLAEFDRVNARTLHDESRILSGESTVISDTVLPTSFQREVIREALTDLNILNVVNTMVDPNATATMDIPYEERDMSAVVNGGRTFEGQAINGASIAQKMDLAYIFQRKLGLSLSNEVMHFSRASAINWDAWGRNVSSNAQIMRELVAADIANEIQRTADSFGAADIADEDIAAQLGGSKSTIKTAQFPVVRQHQRHDLQGNAIGDVDNPIVVKFGATVVPAYNGTGTQASGTYYMVSNYNLGYIKFVTELGAETMPDEGTATISYSYSNNGVKFDLDVPSGTTNGKHLDGLLELVGARKATMKSDRFILPDFTMMSSVLNEACTNADRFAASMKRNGSDTTASGDLEAIKNIAAYGTDQPGIDLGDERLLMGLRNTTTYGIAKPYQIGMPFEMVDSTGKPIGKKGAYGEEYATIHTPKPIKNRYTSVIAYSAAARAAV